MDSSLVVEAIEKLNLETRVKNPQFATSLSGHSVIIKKIELPSMTPEELAESIQWEAEQYIPFDINDVRMDYVLLNPEGGGEQMEVLLVAVKRDKVNDYVSVIGQTGRTPALVDVDVFAIQNAYELNYDVDRNKIIALVNMGAAVTNINVLARGQTLFWRDISFGGNQFTEALQREFNLTFENAEALKRGRDVEGRTASQARPVLETVGAEMAGEVQKTFDFFSTTANEGSVDQVVLSGGGALTAGLRDVLAAKLGCSIELMNPLRRIQYRESDFSQEWIESIAPMMAVSVGLALRRVGD
jgi:type IV pilus assembly protein PilM